MHIMWADDRLSTINTVYVVVAKFNYLLLSISYTSFISQPPFVGKS